MSYAKLGMAALAGLAAIRVSEDYLGERNALLEAYKQKLRDTHREYADAVYVYKATPWSELTWEDPFWSDEWRGRHGWSQYWRQTFNSDRVRKALKLPLSRPESTRVPAVKKEHRAKVDGITWVVKPSTMSVTRHGYADWPQRHDLRHRVFIESPCGRDIPAGRYQFHKCDVPHRGIKIRIPATQGAAARGRRAGWERKASRPPSALPHTEKAFAKRELNPYSKRYTYAEFKQRYFKDSTVSNRIAKEFWYDFRYAFNGGLQKYIKRGQS